MLWVNEKESLLMNHSKKHPYHLVEPSPWPLVTSFSVFVLAVGAVLFMHHIDWLVFAMGSILVVAGVVGWWFDVIKESNQLGVHTPAVQKGLKIGMVLFIASEIMLFVALRWF